MVYLIRHAKAQQRDGWKRADALRPLSPLGELQARAIAERLETASLERIVSSPYLRCRKTVEPLAYARGIPLELDGRLAEGEDVAKGLEVLRELRDRPAVICTHGDLIPALLGELEEGGLAIRGRLRCEKGSIWVLERNQARAFYLPPPRKRDTALQEERAPAAGRAKDAKREPVRARVAVLDLGSTSFQLLVADATSEGEIQRIERERIMLRLGALIATDRRVPDEVAARVVHSARALRRVAEQARAQYLVPVATEALREAENGRALAERIGDALGAPVRILTGEEEARLIFAAFREQVRMRRGSHLGLDLGGGSLELALGDERDVDWETTLPLGVARLHGELVRSDPMTGEEIGSISTRVRELLAPHCATLRSQAPKSCIAAGGSIRALARCLLARQGQRPNRGGELRFSTAELRALAWDLVRSTHEERLRTPGVPSQRADLLPTGALVLEAIAAELDLNGFTVSPWGLREGVILETMGRACSARRS
jgi:exopolyphosphatase/guanosine-5'-triphosphate,3'-diphosphate pyrophosphatase